MDDRSLLRLVLVVVVLTLLLNLYILNEVRGPTDVQLAQGGPPANDGSPGDVFHDGDYYYYWNP